jgi:hypothetical protein
MARPKSKELTISEQLVLTFITEQKAAGTKPTLRKIADKMGWKATATAYDIVNRLRQRKLLSPKRKTQKSKTKPNTEAIAP